MKQQEPKGKILFFTGEETFLLKEKLRAFKKASEQKYGEFNTLSVNLQIPERGGAEKINKQTKEIATEFLTPSFFGDKRVIFLENYPVSNTGKKIPAGADIYLLRILDSLEKLPSENVVVLSSENPDKRTKIYKRIIKIADQTVFNKLQGMTLHKWIIQKASSLKGKINLKNAEFLVNYCSNNLWTITLELKKLANYCDQAEITQNDIKKVCIQNTEVIDFGLSNAMQSGNFKKTLDILHDELDIGTHPQVIISRDLATVFRQMLAVKWGLDNHKLPKETGVHPYVFSKWTRLVRRLSLEKLKNGFRGALKLDEDLKTGGIDIIGGDYSIFSLRVERLLLEVMK